MTLRITTTYYDTFQLVKPHDCRSEQSNVFLTGQPQDIKYLCFVIEVTAL